MRLLRTLVLASLFLSGCQTRSSQERLVRVGRGDSLSSIADRYQLSWQEIARFNGLRHPHRLRPGQTLRIPPKGWISEPFVDAGHAGTTMDRGNGLLYGQSRVIWPARGKITSGFGKRRGRRHSGIDIAAPRGTRIYAVADGVVESSGWMRGYGRTILVRHGRFKTLYAHCSRLRVHKGERVRKGQVIGLIGSSGNASGNHLHFEYRNLAGVPRNPRLILPESTALSQN